MSSLLHGRVSDRHMSSSKICVVSLLMWLVMLQVTAAPADEEAQERRLDVMTSRSLKKKQLNSLLDLLNTIGLQEQDLDQTPHDFVVLVKTTVYMQTPLCCLVLLYGLLHLDCCSTLFQKCFGAKAKPQVNEDEFEMVKIERDGEITDRDVIVNFSNAEV